ncbi:hypothetical protein EBU24_01925 [bacterium]|nr:hypothetical protein [bacterium]
MPQYGYAAHRMSFDSTLQIPTFCGVPTLKSNVLKFGAIAFDSCNNRFYFYNPKTAVWDTIKGGGGSTDTTSLSNRINLKLNISDTSAMLTKYLRKTDTTNKFVNNITRTLGKDSIIYFIGSTRYAIKDSVGTNPAPVGYYGAFQDTINQTAAVINTGYPMKLRVNDLTNGVTIVSDSRITIANTGIYNLQWSAQFTNPLASEHDVTIWLRKNGVDVPGSAGIVLVPPKHGSFDGHTLPSWNFLLSAVGGDYYEFVWSTANISVYISFNPAGNPPPSTASVVLTVTQQSGIMAGTGMTALNGLSGAVQTFAVDSTNSTFKITSSGTAHTFNIPNASASGVTRGLISNTQYTTFNNKIGSGDTASMLLPYSRIIDTASMLTKYLRKTDTSTLSTRINAKYTFPTLTSGSVLYTNGTTITQNNTNFFWDNTNSRLGIGTNSPTTRVQIALTNTDYTNTNGAGSHIYMSNGSTTGQNVLSSFINGTLVAKWRTDYAGNINWVAGGTGNHYFFTGGDYLVGNSRLIIYNGGNVAIGTNTASDPGYKLDVAGTARATQFQLSALNTAPATATSTGTLGEIRIVNGAIYVCVATNTWQRALLTTF